jgi:hypothetical protein
MPATTVLCYPKLDARQPVHAFGGYHQRADPGGAGGGDAGGGDGVEGKMRYAINHPHIEPKNFCWGSHKLLQIP